jgi:hypothetical protein
MHAPSPLSCHRFSHPGILHPRAAGLGLKRSASTETQRRIQRHDE